MAPLSGNLTFKNVGVRAEDQDRWVLRHVDLENGAVVGQQVLLADSGKRLRDVRTGPDGALYLLTDYVDGEVLRIVPE